MSINKELEIIVNYVSTFHPKVYKEATRTINDTREKILQLSEGEPTEGLVFAEDRNNNSSRRTRSEHISA